MYPVGKAYLMFMGGGSLLTIKRLIIDQPPLTNGGGGFLLARFVLVNRLLKSPEESLCLSMSTAAGMIRR